MTTTASSSGYARQRTTQAVLGHFFCPPPYHRVRDAYRCACGGASITTSTAGRHDSFVHPAFFYRSDEEYLAGLLPFSRSDF